MRITTDIQGNITGLHVEFRLADCRGRHVNGPRTEKEVVLEARYEAQDPDGHFENWRQISIPLPKDADLRAVQFIGKTMKVTIE